jgi:hypothetical protein
VSRREIVFLAGGLAALVLLMLFLSDGWILITRPFWVDEVFTVLVGGQRSPARVIADLAHGADGGAGLLHLGVWAVRAVTGSSSPTLLRLLSLACVLVALCLTYLVLRRRFGAPASVAGVLAVGANGLVVTHSFEARFYGPWLLCCALFAWSLGRNQEQPTRRRAVTVSVAAMLLCTAHFYGVISLLIMIAAVIASYGRRWRDGLRVVAPSAAAIPVLVAIAPIAIGIRGAFSVRSWIPPFELAQLDALARRFWFAEVPMLAALALVAAIVMGWRNAAQPTVTSVARHAATDAGVVALTSLALMPLALVAVSFAGQSSVLPRYSTVAALAWGPWVAFSLASLGLGAGYVARIALAWFWFVSYTNAVHDRAEFATAMRQTDSGIKQLEASGLPVVFQSIHVLYPLRALSPVRDSSALFLELPDSTFRALFPLETQREVLNRGLVIDRDMTRIHARLYGFPRSAAQTTLDSTPRFLLVAPEQWLPKGVWPVERFGRLVFPHHRGRRIHPDILLLERQPF